MNECQRVTWGPQSSGETTMPLDPSIHQYDAVRMLLKEKEKRDRMGMSRHNANLLDLQCDSDSNMEEDDLLATFEYQVSSVENPEVYAASHDSQKKCGRGCPSHDILDQKARITKEQIQRERSLSTPKTLQSGEWRSSQVMISESSQPNDSDVLNMTEGDDSDGTMNVNDLTSKTVKFADSKGKTKVSDGSAAPKIKNVRLTDVLRQMAEENSTQIVQKMLHAVVSDITVKDLLTSESIAHKMMFKLRKPDIMTKISEPDQVNINSTSGVRSCHLSNVLYSSASPRAVVEVGSGKVSVLLNSEVEMNLVQEDCLRRLNISYTIDCHLRLVDINGNETVLRGICENMKIKIGPVSVMQSLLIVESASQPMVLSMPYASAMFMISQSYPSDIINIEIKSPNDDRCVQFQGVCYGLKMKYLSQLFPHSEFSQRKE